MKEKTIYILFVIVAVAFFFVGGYASRHEETLVGKSGCIQTIGTTPMDVKIVEIKDGYIRVKDDENVEFLTSIYFIEVGKTCESH